MQKNSVIAAVGILIIGGGLYFLLSNDDIAIPKLKGISETMPLAEENTSVVGDGLELSSILNIESISESIPSEEQIVRVVEETEASMIIHPDAYEGIVTKIVDGNTMHVDGAVYRLSLIDTPERGEDGFEEATSALAELCPVGGTVYVEDDSIEPRDSYGRSLGVAWCGGNDYETTAGQYMHENGHLVKFYTGFCGTAEAATEAWALDTNNWFYHDICTG